MVQLLHVPNTYLQFVRSYIIVIMSQLRKVYGSVSVDRLLQLLDDKCNRILITKYASFSSYVMFAYFEG